MYTQLFTKKKLSVERKTYYKLSKYGLYIPTILLLINLLVIHFGLYIMVYHLIPVATNNIQKIRLKIKSLLPP